MEKINDYLITEQLYEGDHVRVFRATSAKDKNPVILKIHKDEFPADGDISKFRREFEIGKKLSDPLIVRYIALEQYRHQLVIIEEDTGAVSLKEIIPASGFSTVLFLKIAIQTAKGIDVIHRNNIVHRAINPHHLIIDRETTSVRYIDFGASSPLDQEIQAVVSPAALSMDLAYISPEQTGRMNRIMDYRSDFYSVGITFYELITGRLPFDEKKPLALIHSQIAKTPASPHEVRSDIPAAISDIIMKLMEKNAENRYQTANGLLLDLQECLQQFETKGTIEHFSAGQNDLSDRFHIQQKLYGRDKEIKQLLDSFDQVSTGNVRSSLMLVYGYSGIGKSALINEVHKSLVREKGYFVSGKYDQFKRNIPYSSFIQAFHGLMKQILSEDDESVAGWKTKIIQALGDNGQVIVDVIPDVEMIIGPQDPVPKLGAVENQNRFNRVLQNFSGIFAKKEHPLVIFLDDLQWADLPTLNLMKLMITNPDFQYLFFIGAFRDNEVDSSHPLTGILNDIEEKHSVERIAVVPLVLKHVNHIISDSLKCHPDLSKPLAELVYSKTLGNPFFVNMFLTMLYQEKLIAFDRGLTSWTWDLQKIQAIGIAENVVDLMVTRILKLAEESQQLLSIASFIGNQFDLKTLAIVHGASVADTYRQLWSAVKQGLIMPVEVEYKWVDYVSEEKKNARFCFLHDRVQQAAYSLVAERNRPRLHLKTGRLFLRNMSADELEENIFEVVNHLNEGRNLISDSSEREQLARLNLRAAEKAKLSSAYEPALNYVNAGMECLPENSWQSIYKLTLSYYLEKGEIEYLNSNWDSAISTFDEALEQALSLLDRSVINEYKCTLYRMKNDLRTSLDLAIQTLGELGIQISSFPQDAEVMAEIRRAKNLIANRDIEELFNLPELNNPEKLAAMRLLKECLAPAYFLGSRLSSIIGIRMLEITINHGNCPHSSVGYIFFSAITLAVDLNDFDEAYKFGLLALKLNNERYHEKAYEALVLDMWGAFVCHYKEPLNKAKDHLMRGYASGLEHGSYQWAGYCAMIDLFMTFWGNNTLDEVTEKIERVLPGLEKIDPNMAQYYYAVRAAVFNLKEAVSEKTLLAKTMWPNVDDVLKVSHEQDDMLTLLVDATCRLSLANWYFDYEKAIAYAEIGEKYAVRSPGVFINPVFQFHQCLAYASVCDHVGEQERTKYLQKIKSKISAFEHRSVHCPTTYLHQALLVKAELARLEGDVLEAMDLYDQAIESAQVNGFIQNEAHANEIAGRFWLSLGKRRIAESYLKEACYCYERWGARQKGEDIEKRYAEILRQNRTGDSHTKTDGVQITSITPSETLENLDITTVIKFSQAISSEIDLKNLLSKVMDIIIENAGAQRGFLILKRDEKLRVEATVDSTSGEIEVLQSIPIDKNQQLSQAIVRYVTHTGENVVLQDASRNGMFVDDPYIMENQPKSILCMPIQHKDEIVGVLYLENNLAFSAFSENRVKVLHTLLVQAAISLENARLYTELKQEITERELAEGERNRLIEELGKKNVELSRFVYTVSHDLKSPLITISAYAGKLMGELNAGETEHAGRRLIRINEAAERMSALLESLLELSRIGRQVNPPVELAFADLAQEVVELLAGPIAETGAVVDINVGAVKILGDPIRLREVLQNLIENSLKFAGDQSQLQVEIGARPDRDQIVYYVRDNGIGIDPTYHERVFDLFDQLDPKLEGTGTGLALVKQIVEYHGGRIWIESEGVGKGATFCFSLPPSREPDA